MWVFFQYYPLEEVLAAEYLLEDFRPDLIEMVLDKLRPEYVRLVQEYLELKEEKKIYPHFLQIENISFVRPLSIMALRIGYICTSQVPL